MPNEDVDPVARLRQLSTEELARVGEDSLKARLVEQATYAHQKYGALLAAGSLDAFLADSDCLRYPTRIIFEFGEMAGHQFAQPDVDRCDPTGERRVLYLRPALRGRADLVRLAVAYTVPVINYGEIIGDEHCLLYGATLLGMMEQEFYDQVCALADYVQAEPRFPDSPSQ